MASTDLRKTVEENINDPAVDKSGPEWDWYFLTGLLPLGDSQVLFMSENPHLYSVSRQDMIKAELGRRQSKNQSKKR